MVIGGASNTNVGIGTASPGAKLDVNQTAAGIFGIRISRVGGASDANNWYLWNMDGSYGNDFEIWQYPNDSSPSCCIQRLEIQDDGDTVLVPSGGNVGIGTAGPAAKLHVLSTGDVAHEIFDTSSTANKRVRINFAQNGVSNMEIGTDYSLSNTADLYIYNRSTGQTAAYFNPAGNVWFSMAGSVGIGTTSPAQKLHVAGNIRIDSGAVVSGTRSNFFLALQSDRNLVLYDNGSAVWASGTSTSDIRLKKNVKDIGRVLDKLEKIRAVSFNFKDDETNRKEIGVIAQELEKDFPELIYIDPKSGYKLVDYPKLTALLLQAIRDLQSDTDKKISAVSDKLEALSKRVDKMSGK
ncbi:MAG: tail fiber domain-containing protein [Candidatus Omnitrophota bacterium]